MHAGWRTAGWTAGSSVRAGGRVLDAARSGQPPTELLAQAGAEARDYALKLLGLAEAIEAVVAQRTDDPSDIDETPRRRTPRRRRGVARAPSVPVVRSFCASRPTCATRRRPTRPTSASSESWRPTRPASCASCREGAQPAVDVRVSKTLGVTSELVAPGLSMIGEQAGCRYLDRVPAYLNNLYRLGLIWFSREPLEDPLEYQVLEAQPEVIEALRRRAAARPSAAAST